MDYKPDWEQAQNRLHAFWNHEVLDRCCIAVHAPKEGSLLPAIPDLQNGPWMVGMDAIAEGDQAAIDRWWQDPDLNYERAITWFENAYFGGEALPITYINWGAMSLAAMYGSSAHFNRTSVWYPAVIEDWDKWQWRFDPATDPTWQMIEAILDRFIAGAPGRYLVGTPELGNGADVLSLLRGMDNLAVDLLTNPEAVKHGVDVISDTWVQLMEHIYQKTTAVNADGDVLAWMGLWAPGKMDQIACDFASVISPAMFTEFFAPEVIKLGDWCDYGVFHLDGPACIKHTLDPLLEIPQIKAIQFTPGVGSRPTYTEAYIPRYRQILASGRNLYLLVQPDEVEKILAELPPEGLFMRTYVESQAEADEMLKNVSKWSARGNQTRVP
jgi:hypothetical protein